MGRGALETGGCKWAELAELMDHILLALTQTRSYWGGKKLPKATWASRRPSGCGLDVWSAREGSCVRTQVLVVVGEAGKALSRKSFYRARGEGRLHPACVCPALCIQQQTRKQRAQLLAWHWAARARDPEPAQEKLQATRRD